jgi:hypothetical protein
MKLTNISRAVLATCGTLASVSAFALPATSYDGTQSEFVGSTQNIRVSGATAQDSGLLGSALQLCTAGSLHRYAISNNFVFLCTPDIGTNPGQIVVRPGASQLAIYKYSVGGSGAGVDPVNNASVLPFLDLAKIATSPACTGTNLVSTVSDFNGTVAGGTYVNNTCSGASSLITTDAVPYIGLSDMEPAFFTGDPSNLLAENFSTLIFGVPVTTNIRNALQTQQLATAVPKIGNLAAGCVGLNTLDCMPSLTRGQITSAFTQGGQTWAGIGVTSGLADDTIYVARRVNSSGTQKTFEAIVANTPNGDPFKTCVSGVDVFVSPDSGTLTGDASADCASAPPLVFAGSGGGDVSACMNGHNANSRGSIGMQTGETKPATAAGWRFVKVDGNAPIHADVASGRYQFWTQASINTRIGATLPTASALGYSAYVSRIKTDLKNPTIVALVNGSDQTFGKSGIMANLPTGGTPDFTGASIINPMNRLVAGTTVDNCQSPKAPF